MKTHLTLLLCCFFLTAGLLQSQTTWNGFLSNNWNTAVNWSNGVPDNNDDVTIPSVGGSNSNPTIPSGTVANVRSITINSGGRLTVSASATLTFGSSGLVNRGTVNNNGTITISQFGLTNFGTFNNNSGANLQIGSANSAEILNETGANFTNAGRINLGSASSRDYGILNKSIFDNTANGVINIDYSTAIGLYNQVGTFTNAGSINIGATAAVAPYAFRNDGTFNNNACAQLSLFAPFANPFAGQSVFTNNGLLRVNTAGEHYNAAGFTNNGIIEQVQSSLIPSVTNNDLIVAAKTIECGTWTNMLQKGGSVSFTPATTWYANSNLTTAVGTYNNSTNTFTPIATLTTTRTFYFSITPNSGTSCPRTVAIVVTPTDNATTWTGAVSTSWSNVSNWTCGIPLATDDVVINNVTNDPVIPSGTVAVAKSLTISTGAALTIQSGGTLNLNGSSAEAFINRGTVTNAGIVNIGATTGSGGNGLQNESAFTNNAGGQLNINRATGTALDNRPGATLTNQGTINIGGIAQPTGYHGIYNSATINNNASGVITINNSTGRGIVNAGGTINNNGTFTIGNTASVGEYALYNQGAFNNNACSILSIFAPFYNSSSSFANLGLFRVNTTGTHANSGFTNNGVIEQVQSNAIPNVTNNDLVIALVSICGAPFIIQRGGAVSFTPAATWYTNPDFTTVAGTYNQNNNTFAPNGSYSGLQTFYFSISDDTNGCPRTVSISVQFVDNLTTWNGSSSTNWNTASNWTCGIPDALDVTVIPDVTNDPIILGGTTAQAKQIGISSGGLLTVSANASLTLNGSATEQSIILLQNQGTVSNNGTIQAGTASNQSIFGIRNAATGVFNNNAGGTLRLDYIYSRIAAPSGALVNQNTFNNAGNIFFGTSGTVGITALRNERTFTNSGAGQIVVNQFSANGIFNQGTNASFTNSATITIGSASAGTNGIQNGSTFTNQAAGIITINNTAQNGFLNASGAILNNYGQMNIGANASPGTNGVQNAGSFTNQANGSINIDQATDNNLYNALNGTFVNDGGVITLGTTANTAGYSLRNEFSFFNDFCSRLYLEGGFFNGATGNGFVNTGLFSLSGNGLYANNGSFLNNGVLAYGPGTVNTISGVTNNSLIVPRVNQRCNPISPVLQIGGTPTYGIGGTWYFDQALTSPAGTYSSNTFNWTSFPSPGIYTLYFSASRTNPPACSFAVPIQMNVLSPANAGPDQTGASTCGLTTVTLAANSSNGVGTGAWSIVSGIGGSFSNPARPNSTFSGVAGNTYILSWTITSPPCAPSTDQVIITFNQNPTTPNAGPDQTDAATCGLTTVTLAANTPTVGTGVWTVVNSTSGSFSQTTSPTSTFTGTAGSTYTLRWIISNAPCNTLRDEVAITFNQNPTQANAGPDQTICSSGGTATMAGNTPGVGTGLWTKVSGPAGGTISTPSLATTTITALTTAGTYIFQWSISNAPCATSSDQVSIIVTAPPTAYAGLDQTICTTSGTATMAGNTPSAGTGLWTKVDGPAGETITTSSSPNTTITGMTTAGTYTFQWRITSGPCTASDQVSIIVNTPPTTANAGLDRTDATTCGLTQVTLAANTPTVGTGQWTIQSGVGGSFANAASPTTTFSGVAGNSYTLRWTISNAPCTASFDEMTVTFNRNLTVATAGSDQTGAATCGLTQVTLAANTPTVGTGAWSIVGGAGGSFSNVTSPTSTFSGVAGTMYILRWTITNGSCTSFDDVEVTFNQSPIVSCPANLTVHFSDPAFTLTGGSPVGGTYSGTGVSGGMFNPATAGGGTHTITYRYTNAAGCSGSCTFTITVNTSVSCPGNMTVCSSAPAFTLTGGSPAGGTYSGTGVSGGQFNPAVAGAGVHTITYTNGGSCTFTITVNALPTTADAGLNQTGAATCGLTSVALAANTPTVGTGAWSIVSGTGGSFANAANPSTTFSGVAGSTYTLRWTISNAPCAASTDDVVVTFNQNPIVSCPQNRTVHFSDPAFTLTGGSPVGGTYSGPGVSAGIFNPATAGGGTHTITYSYTNAAGCSGSCTFTITVNTSVSCPGNMTVCSSDPAFTLTGGSPAGGTYSGTGVSGGQFNPAVAGAGVHTITYTNDGFCTFTIRVNALPTAANAGPDQTGAATCGLAQVTLAANAPAVGTGAWSVVSGTGGSFANTASSTSTFTGTAGSTYTLRWTITNAPCTASFDEMTVTFNRNPTVANAGPDQTGAATCGLTTVTLAANTPAVGTGAWSIVSGTGGSFGNASSPNSTFSGVVGNTYTLRWTISNAPCAASTDDVVVTFNQNPTVSCPANLTVNSSDPAFNLIGGSPVGGTYSGPGVSGGTFNPASAGGGTHTITYTYTTAAGCSGSCTFTITVNTSVSCPSNMTVCISEPAFTLTGGSPTGGTYSGAGVSGGQFNPAVAGAGVHTITYTNGGSCTFTITVNALPRVANAGPDQTGAATCGVTQVTLAGNAPTVGTGQWSIRSGTGGSFGNASSPNSTFSGSAGSTYVLRWTISNAPCAASFDEITVTFNRNPTVANAGPDQTGAATCGLTRVTLAANTPAVGTGAWSIVGGTGGSFANAASPSSTFSGVAGNTYTLRWTISNAPCTASTDDVTVTLNQNPIVSCPANLTVNSSDPAFTLSGGSPAGGTYSGPGVSGGTFNPANAGSGTHTITYRYMNAVGCLGSCTFTITVNSTNSVQISGTIIWEHDKTSGVGNTTVDLKGDKSMKTTTPSSGVYSFSLNSGSNFTVTPTKNTNKLNGLSSADAMAIQQYISNQGSLPTPYKRIAADVDKSKSVTGLDAALISQVLLGNQQANKTFNTSWRFVPVSYSFPVPDTAWSFPEQITLTGVNGNVSGQDFYGIKLGDVAPIWANPANFGAGEPLVFRVQDRVLESGTEIVAEFRADQLNNLNSFQFALHFDPQQLQLEKIEPLKGLPVSMENFGTFNLAEGEIRMVWSQATPVLLAEAAPVFRLRFRVLERGSRLSDVLQLDNDALPGHSYKSDYAESGVELRYLKATGATASGITQPLSLDNLPNPFSSNTVLRFVLPQDGEAELRVSDATGRLLFTQKKYYTAGQHQEALQLEKANGVLFAELLTKQGRVVRKMLAVQN